MGGSQSYLKRFLSSRIFLVLLLILILVFLTGFLKAFWRDYQIHKEINALTQEKERWEKNKIELLNRLQEIKSDSFAEKEARLKFTLGQPGESLVIITDSKNQATTSLPKNSQTRSSPSSNLLRWWKYFFE